MHLWRFCRLFISWHFFNLSFCPFNMHCVSSFVFLWGSCVCERVSLHLKELIGLFLVWWPNSQVTWLGKSFPKRTGLETTCKYLWWKYSLCWRKCYENKKQEHCHLSESECKRAPKFIHVHRDVQQWHYCSSPGI